MVERALAAIVTWIGELFDGIVQTFLSQIHFSTGYILGFLPGLYLYKGFITILGLLAVFACLVIAALQMMAAPITGQEKQSAISVIVRALVAGSLVMVASQLTDPFINIVDSLYNWISSSTNPDAISVNSITAAANDRGILDSIGSGVMVGLTTIIITVLAIILKEAGMSMSAYGERLLRQAMEKSK